MKTEVWKSYFSSFAQEDPSAMRNNLETIFLIDIDPGVRGIILKWLMLVFWWTGRVPVPDARFEHLCEHYKPARSVNTL